MFSRGFFVCLILSVALSGLAKAQTADFYVATDGNDSWSGTLPSPNSHNSDGPFATVSRAQQAVEGILGNPGGRSTPITVMIRQGTYWQSQPLEFTSADAGTSQLKVIWENYPNETPVISGGMQLTGWRNVSGNEWQVTLPTNTQYFEQLFYNGVRRFRPRLGASSGSNIGTYYRVLKPIYLSGSPPPSPPPDPNCPIYVSGSGWECFDRFKYNSSDPISSSWKNLAPPAGNPCNQPAGNANLVGDIHLIDFETWSVTRLRISCIDPNAQIIYMTGAAPSTYQAATHGFIANHRYIVENIKDELQEPGQWFLDRSSSSWVVTYLANSGENPNSDLVVVPQASQVLVAYGLSYVTFQGIYFEHDNFVIPPAGYQSSQGDYGIPAAVSCQNCSNVVFDSDVVTETAGGGLELISCVNTFSPSWCAGTHSSGKTNANVIQNGAFYDIGGEAIRIGSGSQMKDTDSNVPHNNSVTNNVLEGVGRVFPSAYAIAQGSGHDNTYNHNDIYDSYHSAIGICEAGCPPGSSNSKGTFNNVISFNHVYNLMQGIMSDTGALYISTGSTTFSAKGNQVLNNKVHDVTDAKVMDTDGYGGYGIKLDANTGGVLVQNNLIYRTTDHPMTQTLGPQVANASNIIANNIISFTPAQLFGVVSSAPAGVSQFTFAHNLVFYSLTEIQIGCAYCPGKGCKLTSVQDYAQNMYCDLSHANCALDPTPFRTTDATCNQVTHQSWSSWQGLGEDLGSMNTSPLFVNPYYPTDNFALQSGSPATQIGFVPFDVNAPGRTSDTIQPPAVAATFPTGSYVTTGTLTITSSSQPITYGDTVDLTANATSYYGPPPDGTEVTFTEGSKTLGTATTTQGVATLGISGLSVGTHLISASYPGTEFWTDSTSPQFSQRVAQADSSSTVQSNANPAQYGQAITFTAVVTGTTAGATPTGTVTFSKGAPIGTSNLVNGVAKLTVSTLGVSTWNITAKYSGDANYNGSTSPAISQVVNKATSTTKLTSSPNPSNSGQTVTLTATVTCSTTSPTGQVNFMDGTKSLGNRSLSNGVATLQVSNFSSGTHSLTAVYNGSGDVNSSTSSVVKQKVN